MEGHSHFSEKKHGAFLERFKGRITTIDKNGHMGVAAKSSKPIERCAQSYLDTYSECGRPSATMRRPSEDPRWHQSPTDRGDMTCPGFAMSSSQLVLPPYCTPMGAHNNPYTSWDASLSALPTAAPEDRYMRPKRYQGEDYYGAPGPGSPQDMAHSNGLSRAHIQRAGYMSVSDSPDYSKYENWLKPLASPSLPVPTWKRTFKHGNTISFGHDKLIPYPPAYPMCSNPPILNPIKQKSVPMSYNARNGVIIVCKPIHSDNARYESQLSSPPPMRK
jgi:hypothetical protein